MSGSVHSSLTGGTVAGGSMALDVLVARTVEAVVVARRVVDDKPSVVDGEPTVTERVPHAASATIANNATQHHRVTYAYCLVRCASVECAIDAPMCCQGASDVAGRPVMGHSGEGELLLGRAVSGREGLGWRSTDRSKDNR